MRKIIKQVKLLKPFKIDDIVIEQDDRFPGAYLIDLPMDSVPDHNWQDNFEKVWKSSQNLWDRKLFVIGDKLRLVTTVDNFDEKLVWIERVINETNEKIEEYNRQIRKEEKRTEDVTKQMLDEEMAKVEMIRHSLRQRFA